MPTAFFKIVVDHNGARQTEVEAVTGLDFLSALPEEEQEVIEAGRAREVWPLVAPPADEGDEGQDDDG